MIDSPPDRSAPIPLKIRRADDGTYRVWLGDLDISRHLLAEGGVKFSTVKPLHNHPASPQVTLTFAPWGYGLDLDLDDELRVYARGLDEGEGDSE